MKWVDAGFEVAGKACCGTGTFEMSYLCNQENSFTCPDATKYVFWDAFHPTEKTNQIIVNDLLRILLPKFSWPNFFFSFQNKNQDTAYLYFIAHKFIFIFYFYFFCNDQLEVIVHLCELLRWSGHLSFKFSNIWNVEYELQYLEQLTSLHFRSVHL